MCVKKHFDVLFFMGPMCLYILDMNQFYLWLCADWNESLCGRGKLQLWKAATSFLDAAVLFNQ